MIIYDFESKGWVELVSLKPASKRVESHFDTVNRKSDIWFCTYIAYFLFRYRWKLCDNDFHQGFLRTRTQNEEFTE